jgi:hypothetical protein
MSLLQRLFGGDNQANASQEEVIELTNQFYVTLRAYFAKVKADGKVRNQEAFNRIEELLKPGRTQNWTNAYEIEQLPVHLFTDETLVTELYIRTLEARSVLRPELAILYNTQAREAESFLEGQAEDAPVTHVNEQRRTLLSRLVNDLQWRYIVNEATRRYSKLITSRTALLSVWALMVFTALIVFTIYVPWTFRYGDMRLLLVAGLAGAWGATFSMLTSLKGRLAASTFDDLKLMRSWALLVSRALIGAGAASILFFFLLSGLLGGTAFPTLIQEPAGVAAESRTPQAQTSQPVSRGETVANATDSSDNLPKRDLALLIVWCFLAGFSEQLIPGLLASTEARANGSRSTTSDRFQPTTGITAVPPPPDSGRPDGQRRESQRGSPVPPATSDAKAAESG